MDKKWWLAIGILIVLAVIYVSVGGENITGKVTATESDDVDASANPGISSSSDGSTGGSGSSGPGIVSSDDGTKKTVETGKIDEGFIKKFFGDFFESKDDKDSLGVQHPTCVDSDGGIDYYSRGQACIKGDLTGSQGCAYDKCLSGTLLREFYCAENNSIASDYFYCPTECFNGACTEQNQPTVPNLHSVRDYPDPIELGEVLTFESVWENADGGNAKLIVCKTPDQVSGECVYGGGWCNSVFSPPYQSRCTYRPSGGDVGVNDYYAYQCNVDGDCDQDYISGTFAVVENNQLPDLVITDLDVLLGNVTGGNATSNLTYRVYLTATVKNIGGGTAGSSHTRFGINPGYWSMWETPALIPGQSALVGFNWFYVEEGDYEAYSDADWLHEITESDENNNHYSVLFSTP